MREPDFLDIDDIVRLHELMIEEHGGSAGLRDPGLLESAAAMPRQRMFGEYLHTGLASMAAAYLFHLCQNHPFADGNKRVAFLAAFTFLDQNGVDLEADEDEAADVTLAVARGEMGKAELTRWIGERSVERAAG